VANIIALIISVIVLIINLRQWRTYKKRGW
jgi:hypothetical protein